MNVKVLIFSAHLSLITIFTSFNYKLLVKKEAVINSKTGFILFTEGNDYFIPADIGRMDDFTDFVKNKKLTKNIGFLLSN